MKTHVVLTVVLIGLAGILLAGCATMTEDAYPGDPRPPEEIAKVSLPTFIQCTRVDGRKPWADLWWVNFLPGEHSLQVSVTRRSKKFRYDSPPVTLPFIVEAGHQYQMKVCFFYVDEQGEIVDPHVYYVQKQGGSKTDARHALGLQDRETGWIYLDWLPEPLDVKLSWTPYVVDKADGRLAPHPDPKVTGAIRDLLAIVEQQQQALREP